MKFDVNVLPKKINEINYFEKTDNGCTLYSYDSKTKDNVIIIDLDCEIEKSFGVDSKALEMYKLLQPAEIEVTDKAFIVKSKKGRFKAQLLSECIFYKPNIAIENEIKVDIRTLMKATNFVAKNDKRPILTGVRVDENGSVCSTDSFQVYCKNAENQSLSNEGITIPTPFLKMVSDNVDNDVITIRYNKNNIIVNYNSISFVGSLLDGSYPTMEKVIRMCDNATVVEVDKNELLETLNICSNLAGNEPLMITLEHNKLIAVGQSNYEAEIKFENDNLFSLTVVYDNLLRALKTIEEDDICFSVLHNDGIGTMICLLNQDRSEKVLVLGVRKG